MIEIVELSRVGYGGHRASITCKESELALIKALKSGCNLIDTSSNYKNGESEMLIGKVLSNDYDAFIITKAGYITDSNLMTFNKEKKSLTDVVAISDNFKYSIHPDYLSGQIKKSLKQLNRPLIDCFLLHNPEFCYRDPNISEELYYLRIKKAFEYLEEMVKKRKIRYYGISSYFHFPNDEQSKTLLNRVITIANEVSTQNHFKFIQYPHNVAEKKGLEIYYSKNESLQSLAKKNGITTLGNRPFTIKDSFYGNIKLLSLNGSHHEVRKEHIDKNIDKLFRQMQNQLIALKRKEKIEDFEVVYRLKSKWENLTRVDDVKKVFSSIIYTFMLQLYSNDINNKAQSLYKKILDSICNYLRYNESLKTRDYLLDNFLKLESMNDNLAKYLIDEYLNSDGIDHVLVGMRRPKYVDDINPFLKKRGNLS